MPRVKHGPQESVPEGLFDDSINLVVWGHEHDCRIRPERVAGKRYLISQPGSSIATSLAEGEALDKYDEISFVLAFAFMVLIVFVKTCRTSEDSGNRV